MQIACALAKNIQTLMVCRLIGGLTGGAAITVPVGNLADIWNGMISGCIKTMFWAKFFLENEIGPYMGLFAILGYFGTALGIRAL
jgi:MFS family permease